jgi:hypothetical protein
VQLCNGSSTGEVQLNLPMKEADSRPLKLVSFSKGEKKVRRG